MSKDILIKEKYFVGTNKPIKLKIFIETDAIPTTYIYLNNEGDPYDGITDCEPYNPIVEPEWKELSGGKIVKGKTVLVITFFRFYNSFQNEEAFQLAVNQIKSAYQIQIKGEDLPKLGLSFIIESEYAKKTCLVSSETSLI